MNRNRKKLYTKVKEHERLGEGRYYPPFQEEVNRKVRRAYRTYWVTSLVAAVLCISVVWVTLFYSSPNSRINQTVSRFASKIASICFGGFTDSRPSVSDPSKEEATENTSIPTVKDPDKTDPSQDSSQGTVTPPALTLETLYRFDYLSVPKGEVPIIPMDLSLTSYGSAYIQNETGLTPDLSALLSRPIKSDSGVEYMSQNNSPKVLILHTHGTEAYSKDGAVSYRDEGGELARSNDPTESVVALGVLLAEKLNRLGIPTVHSSVLHDKEQYRNAYERAEETIVKYMERYPTIELVIDLHRDSVIKSTGELVRPVTLSDGQAAAQVMCVVGSDWNGEENPNWERNLALSLKLREQLNQACPKLCRPSYLKGSTYNQELAPYSLLLEIGSAGNSLQEAIRSTYLVAEALKEIWHEL